MFIFGESTLAAWGHYLLVGGYLGTLYLSDDSGASWRNFMEGMEGSCQINSFAFTQHSAFLSCEGMYLWQRPLSDFAVSSVSESNPESDTIEFSTNPTNRIVTLSGAEISNVTIANVLGERVMEITQPYSPTFTVDLSKLPSGTYFAKIKTPTGVTMRKILLE